MEVNPNYTPKVAVVVPAYNEAGLIRRKLDNIHSQDYPKDKLDVLVVDSANSDGTPTSRGVG